MMQKVKKIFTGLTLESEASGFTLKTGKICAFMKPSMKPARKLSNSTFQINYHNQAKIKTMSILLAKLRSPNKYYWVANLPGLFDIAEYLLGSWNDLSVSDQKRVRDILIRSGRYS